MTNTREERIALAIEPHLHDYQKAIIDSAEFLERAARAALSVEPSPDDVWEAIETAPKDGTPVILAERTWGGDLVVTPGRYIEDYHGWWEHGSHPTDYADQPIENPTHWAKLPDPPKTTVEETDPHAN